MIYDDYIIDPNFILRRNVNGRGAVSYRSQPPLDYSILILCYPNSIYWSVSTATAWPLLKGVRITNGKAASVADALTVIRHVIANRCGLREMSQPWNIQEPHMDRIIDTKHAPFHPPFSAADLEAFAKKLQNGTWD